MTAQITNTEVERLSRGRLKSILQRAVRDWRKGDSYFEVRERYADELGQTRPAVNRALYHLQALMTTEEWVEWRKEMREHRIAEIGKEEATRWLSPEPYIPLPQSLSVIRMFWNKRVEEQWDDVRDWLAGKKPDRRVPLPPLSPSMTYGVMVNGLRADG